MSQHLQDHYLIRDIMSICAHDIVTEVDYDYVKVYLAPIFTRLDLQRAEGKNKSSVEIMTNIVDKVCHLSMQGFLEFAAALKHDYLHVFNKINCEYRKKTGRDLPLVENNINPVAVPAAVSQPPTESLAVRSLGQAINSTSSTEVSHPINISTAETVSSSNNVSSLPTDTRESNTASTGIRYVSLGPAVPCPSDLVSRHNQTVSLNSSPYSSLSERINNDQISYGNSTLENISSQHSCRSLDFGEPSGVAQRHAEPARLTKYYKQMRKDPSKVYVMDSWPRGCCLVINNEKFKHLVERRGSSEDCRNLSKMFEFLGFEVVPHDNKSTSEMTDLLKEFAKYPKLDQISALAVVILSHGGQNDVIFGYDGAITNNVPVNGTFITKFEIQQIFNGSNCPSMAGKPKLFILQACRGGEEDDKRETSQNHSNPADEDHQRHNQSGSDTINLDSSEVTVSDSPGQGESKIADTADMCFVHSAALGYKAYRATKSGSPFVKLLTEKITKQAHETDFHGIFREVQNEFKTKPIDTTKMSMPEYSSSLTKKWYFNPPDQ